ncbi:hypothetical protein [Streptosporangium fragile]|uniref:hypothetical protein n=1 Tax=Streptosporangium fragile TaxID=46186 RepID=UPI0031EA5E97
MKTLIRAASVGAVIGAAEILIPIYYKPGGGEFAGFAILGAVAFVPFPLGLLLCWVAKLRLWGAVAVLAPFTMFAFTLFELTLAPYADHAVYRSLTVFAGAVAGYLVTAWVFTPGNWVPRVLAVGAIVFAYPVSSLVDDAMRESERIRDLAGSGVPLIAPVIPGYRLAYVNDSLSRQAIELTYQHEEFSNGHRRQIEIDVRPGTAATPEAACARPYPAWDYESTVPCRQVATGVWVRTGTSKDREGAEGPRTTVFATHGDALVQVESHQASEAELLAVLPTFRPTTAAELVAGDP